MYACVHVLMIDVKHFRKSTVHSCSLWGQKMKSPVDVLYRVVSASIKAQMTKFMNQSSNLYSLISLWHICSTNDY